MSGANSGPKLLLNLSLPKTATTYLQALLCQSSSFAAPSIKEPAYFFEMEAPAGHGLRTALSTGNLRRGQAWYLDLFGNTNGSQTLVDMSTQYWLHAEHVVNLARRDFDVVVVHVKRNPTEQLVSYTAHLRRGHLVGVDLEELCASEPTFLEYLDKMHAWPEQFCDRMREIGQEDVVELEFSEVISDPMKALTRIAPELDASSVDLSVAPRNERGEPRATSVNSLLFSDSVRRLGRRFPGWAYAPAVNLRKWVVRNNLRPIAAGAQDRDREFIHNRYGSVA